MDFSWIKGGTLMILDHVQVCETIKSSRGNFLKFLSKINTF